MIRVVFDTNVFLRALINRRSWCGRLIYDLADEYVLISGPAIGLELMKVVARPELHAKFPHLADLDYDTVSQLLDRAEMVDPQAVPLVSRDPKDDIFLACAKEGLAGYLVTEDKDLLVLQDYEGIRIIQPAQFVAILEADRSRSS